jgi:hypothetical protein
MPRFARNTFHILSVLSLTVCIPICGLWVRSYSVVDTVMRSGSGLFRTASGGGSVAVEPLALFHHIGNWRTGMDAAGNLISPFTETPGDYATSLTASSLRAGAWHWRVCRYPGRGPFVSLAWVDVRRPAWPQIQPLQMRLTQTFDNRTGSIDEEWLIGDAVWLPYWLIALTTAALPFLAAQRWIRRGHGPGLCRVCGYDLRATLGRCPECGTDASGVKPPAGTAVASS